MRSTFFGLEIGKTGLTTAQFGLDVTGHNISNLDTAGFTRQRIVSTAYDPFATIGRFAPVLGSAHVGGGVRVQVLDQIRSAFLDRRFRTESTANAYWETRTQSLSYIESYFDNVNEKTSINYSMAEFFRSMTIVSQDPVSGAPRTLMQTTAMDLVQQFNMIYQGLIDFQKVENKAVATKIDDINEMAEQLAELNKAIYGFEITGMIANDLRDKRNLLIDNLARYIDVEYREYPDKFGHSMMEVKIGGVKLVDHDRINKLDVIYIDNVLGPDEEQRVMPVWPHLETTNPLYELDMSKITGGELKAHIDMRDGTGFTVDNRDKGVPYYIEMMNNLARALVLEVNNQHIQGWSDHPDGSKTNILFFDTLGLMDTSVVPSVPVSLQDFIVYYDDSDPPVDLGIDIFAPGFDESTVDFAFKRLEVPDDILRQITAKNINLSLAIQDSAYNIAASSVEIGRPVNNGESIELQRGNNVNMNRMYDLFRKTGITIFDDPTIRRDVGSFDDYGTRIRFDVGNTLHSAKQIGETSRILTLAANNQRTAIAGVSLDEEMVGLVKYNHAYNGAARVITAMDDALDRLINGTGRVGL